MNCNLKKHWTLLALLLGVTSVYAQKEQEEIEKTEDVVVEFSFNPTLSDVFKLKTNPKVKKEFKKAPVTYKITPKKVESDFNPTIKKATYLEIENKKAKNYRNYIYAAAGLYGNTELEALIQPKAYKRLNYGFNLFNFNKQNGIDDDRVDNTSIRTHLNLHVGKNLKKYDWKAEANYDRNAINWYGLSPSITTPTSFQNTDFGQVYHTINFNGTIDYKKGIVKSLMPSVQFFSDEFGTTETQLSVETILSKSLFKNWVETKVKFEYLNGSFSQNYVDNSNVAYSFINLSANPSYTYIAENFKIDAALNLVLNMNSEASKTNFFFLPSIVTTVPIIKNIMIFKGGIESDFKQHSYASLVQQNAFVSPTLNIGVTDVPVKLFAGLQGELSHSISYNTELNYSVQNNKALFVNNTSLPLLQNAYQFGNTFSVVYDDIKVFGIRGNIEADIIKHLRGGLNAAFQSYQTDKVSEAWNLPNINIKTYANYEYKKWFGQLGIDIMGTRKDFVNNQTIDVDGFVDISIKGGYQISKKLNAHLNIYNLLNRNYETFTNYQVQGFQAVAGFSYKF
ncbi:hypothetical protein ACXGQW_07470 [Wenyingzhuangia sp. IMCC45533]